MPTDAVHGMVQADLRRDAPDDAAELSDAQLEQIAAGISSADEPAAAVAAPAPAPTPARFSGYA